MTSNEAQLLTSTSHY